MLVARGRLSTQSWRGELVVASTVHICFRVAGSMVIDKVLTPDRRNIECKEFLDCRSWASAHAWPGQAEIPSRIPSARHPASFTMHHVVRNSQDLVGKSVFSCICIQQQRLLQYHTSSPTLGSSCRISESHSTSTARVERTSTVQCALLQHLYPASHSPA